MEDRNTIRRCYGHVKSDAEGYYFVEKDGFSYFNLPQDDLAKRLAYSNELVIVDIDSSDSLSNPSVKVVEILDKPSDPIPEGYAIAKIHNLIREISEDVRQQVAQIPDKVDTKKELKTFRDLRYIPYITIDPDSANDFDDAVFAEKLDNGTYLVSSPIANVSKYIGGKDSPLFKQVLERGTSTYLGNIVYLMLLEELSNGICSINEGVDRLSLCTTAHIDEDGNVLDYWIEPAVINSRHRLTYAEVDYIYDGTCKKGKTPDDFKGIVAKTIDVKPSIEALFEVSDILKNHRLLRGELDIESRRPVFRLDETGRRIVAVEQEHEEVSTGVIESVAMLVNELNMDAFTRMGVPCIYRNHILPDERSEVILREGLERFGLHLPQVLTGYDLHTVIDKVKGKNIAEPATALILKSLKNAYYSTENDGHVGVGIVKDEYADYREVDSKVEIEKARQNYFKRIGTPYGLYFDGVKHLAYGHITSPIRRGADTIDQMQMMSVITQGDILFDKETLQGYVQKFNELERNSDKASKEYDDMLAGIWANDHIGEAFDGVIVQFDADNVVIMTDDNIKIHIPYNQIRSVHLNPSMIDLIKSKNGGPKSNQRTDHKKKHKSHCRPVLNLGDELNGVMIYEVKSKPHRIYGTEDPNVLNNHKFEDFISDSVRHF